MWQQEVVRYKPKMHEEERMSLTAKQVSGCGKSKMEVVM
jgi:hypothetical protein